jgi:hypothetical protein
MSEELVGPLSGRLPPAVPGILAGGMKCAPGIGPVRWSILASQERPPRPTRRRRSFTPQFKAQIVLEVLSGLRSQDEVARQHKLKLELMERDLVTLRTG